MPTRSRGTLTRLFNTKRALGITGQFCLSPAPSGPGSLAVLTGWRLMRGVLSPGDDTGGVTSQLKLPCFASSPGRKYHCRLMLQDLACAL